jgi:hypothetical protein
MEVLAQSPWNWTLVADGDDLVFDAAILAQGPMSGQYYSVTIVLSSEEAGADAERGTAALDELAEQMNRSTKRYLPRKRLGLDAQIGEACLRWRAERSAGPQADARGPRVRLDASTTRRSPIRLLQRTLRIR